MERLRCLVRRVARRRQEERSPRLERGREKPNRQGRRSSNAEPGSNQLLRREVTRGRADDGSCHSVGVDDILAFYSALVHALPPERDAWISVQRRWIDDQLPDHELVSALREVYRGVAQVIRRAHAASGVELCTAPGFARACVSSEIQGELRCIPRTDPLPTVLLNARTGELARPKYTFVERDEDLITVGSNRYGVPTAFSRDPIAHAVERLELSKRYLEADGYSGPTLVLTEATTRAFMRSPLRKTNRENCALRSPSTPKAPGPTRALYTHQRPGFNRRRAVVDRSSDFHAKCYFRVTPNSSTPIQSAIVTKHSLSPPLRLMEGPGCLPFPFGRTTNGIVYGELMDEAGTDAVPAFLRPIWLRWPTSAWPRR